MKRALVFLFSFLRHRCGRRLVIAKPRDVSHSSNNWFVTRPLVVKGERKPFKYYHEVTY